MKIFILATNCSVRFPSSSLLTGYHLRLSNLDMLHFLSAFQFSLSRTWLKTTSFPATPASCCDRLIEGVVIRGLDERCGGRFLAVCQKRKFRGHGASPQKFSGRESCRNTQTFRIPSGVVNFENFVSGSTRVPLQLRVVSLMAVTTNAQFYVGHNWKLLHELVWGYTIMNQL